MQALAVITWLIRNYFLKGLKMRKTALLTILLSALLMLAAAGCQQSAKKTGAKLLQQNEEMVSIYYLAGKVGMSMSEVTDDKITFNDTYNTVTILPKQNQVYVNNNYVAPLGKTKKIDGLLNVRASMEEDIRSKLPTKSVVEKSPVEAAPTQPTTPQQQPSKSPWELTGKTIVIDAGHGGKDPGTTSAKGFQEKDINLDVAQQIAQILRNKGHRVVMTRDSDEFIELEERAAVANRVKADVFVSIHADSSTRSSTTGFTVYVERSGSWASSKLADAIDNRMTQTSISSNGVKKANYRVLTHTKCPAVLVEIGYLSNYWEAKQLNNNDTQRRLAQAVAEGITDYLKHK
jgi:N-acetylmuramoyl-L-alanine amidase